MSQSIKRNIKSRHSERLYCHSERKRRIWPTKVKFCTPLCLLLALVFVAIGCQKKPTESLHRFAGEGDIEKVRSLITQGADVNAKDKDSITPLHYAAKKGHTDVAEFLVSKGAEVNIKSYTDSTPLYFAAAKGHKGVAVLLIAKGADVNAKNKQGRTPLSLAKNKGYTEILELLRKHGAKE
jgi:ankyrin repeat protein